jgi:pilus assembly protein CpaB
MGKWKAIIPIVLALVIASSVTILIYKWLKKQAPKETVQAESEAVSVVVAAADLPWGTKLEPKMIETLPYIKKSLPPGYSSSPEALEGRVVISPLRQNQPILESSLAPVSVTTGGVSAVVTPGKRALAVKGDKVIGLSGFIRPGNRVDVLVTITAPKTEEQIMEDILSEDISEERRLADAMRLGWSKKSRTVDRSIENEITKTVLEDVLVLATGTEIQENSESGKPHSVDVYTLEVTPEEGERLAFAATKGKLQFALRNVTDREIVLTNGSSIHGTVASFCPKKKKKTRRQEKKATFTVREVINGDMVTVKIF